MLILSLLIYVYLYIYILSYYVVLSLLLYILIVLCYQAILNYIMAWYTITYIIRPALMLSVHMSTPQQECESLCAGDLYYIILCYVILYYIMFRVYYMIWYDINIISYYTILRTLYSPSLCYITGRDVRGLRLRLLPQLLQETYMILL